MELFGTGISFYLLSVQLGFWFYMGCIVYRDFYLYWARGKYTIQYDRMV
jgi:hypothetical protein